jgi:BirA family biotin operon repressor/biotin-[acetyl-CoA-carboxylase] ligase
MKENILLKHSLATKTIGRNFIHLKSTTSTNDYIKDNAGSLDNGCVVMADYQTKGKGRLDHGWEGEKDKSLMFSILLKNNHPLDIKLKVVFAAAVAIKLSIKKLYGVTSYIKWPNDIYIENKKVAGILCSLQSNEIICGMGINVNQEDFKDELKDKASSLYLITGQEKNLFEVLSCVLNYFENASDTLYQEGFYPIKEEVLRHFYLKNKDVEAVSGKTGIKGKVNGMDDEGNLLIVKDEKQIKVSSGDVHICF